MPVTFQNKSMSGDLALHREPFDEYVTVELPDGSSEELEGEYLEEFLNSIGVKDAGKCADYVWNFYDLTIKV